MMTQNADKKREQIQMFCIISTASRCLLGYLQTTPFGMFYFCLQNVIHMIKLNKYSMKIHSIKKV